jgi:hypothetical protein
MKKNSGHFIFPIIFFVFQGHPKNYEIEKIPLRTAKIRNRGGS